METQEESQDDIKYLEEFTICYHSVTCRYIFFQNKQSVNVDSCSLGARISEVKVTKLR